MALETATYISDLVSANPLVTDAVSQGDDHLRLLKSVLKATFTNLNAAVTATPANINNGYTPIGGIIMWSGAISAIPANWHLCDGGGGTPDLRGKFVYGASTDAGAAPQKGSTGGATTSSTATEGAHTHAINTEAAHAHSTQTGSTALSADQLPAHYHNSSSAASNVYTNVTPSGSTLVPTYASTNEVSDGGIGLVGNSHFHTIGADNAHSHGGATVSDGAHAHLVAILPPYVSLAYIQRTA